MTETSAERGAAAPEAHVESVVRRSGTSFFWAMRRMPPEKRNAMYAIYAFCREVDDIADDAGEEGEKMALLGGWREEIEALYAGRPRGLVTRALDQPVRRFGLDKADFLAVIEGMEIDARDSLRIADMDELASYCDRVACAVGRLSNRVFGINAEDGKRIAEALGQALQLTNILRDLHEDARRNRVYLPQSLLRARGIGAADPAEALAHPALAAVCDEIAERARRHFDDAAAMLARCDRRQMRPAVMMMAMYRALFHRVIERGWRHLDRPVAVSGGQKMWIVLRHGII